jgi:hypothetical protein
METELRRWLGIAETRLAQVEPLLPDAEASRKNGQEAHGASRHSGRQATRSDHHWLAYSQLRLSCVVLDRVGKSLETIRQQVIAVGDRLGELSLVLNQLADQFPEHGPVDQPLAESDGNPCRAEAPMQPVRLALDEQLDRLAEEVDRELRASLLAEHGSWELLERRGLLQQVPGVLRSTSRAAVLRALKQLGATRRMLDADGPPRDTLADAEPVLAACGGARRLLVVSPDDELARLPGDGSDGTHPTPSVVIDTDADLILCHEIERLSIARAAAMLIDRRPDYEEVASHLHTRIDVVWTRFEWF